MKVYQIYHNDKWIGFNNAISHKVEYVNRSYVIALYRNNSLDLTYNVFKFFQFFY